MAPTLRTLTVTLALALTCACTDQQLPVDDAHPAGWVTRHGGQATAKVGPCTTCHGEGFEGGSAGVACRSCHLEGPPFGTHPASWGDLVVDHQAFPQGYSWSGCATAACHGTDLRGGHGSGPTGPSCFTAAACHAAGPPAPHEPGFADPALHGPRATAGQLYCRNCHGRPGATFDGGYVSDPAVGLGGRACSTCHPAATAHPTNWQGSNDPTPGGHLSSHWAVPPEAVARSCALCHSVGAAGPGPVAGAPSCFAGGFTNADGGSAGCHADGPGDVHGGEFSRPSRHGPEARADLGHCQRCHGAPGSIAFDGGLAATACAECHPAAAAHPTDWQGEGATSHRAAQSIDSACTICHDVVAQRTAPNPASPSCFSSSFGNDLGQLRACHPSGPGPVHVADFPEPEHHGVQAKLDLTDCQQCHGTPGGTDFGGGITLISCESCHAAARAHPEDWMGLGTYTHTSAANRDSACGLCHDAVQGRGAPDPAAPSCFQAGIDDGSGEIRPCHAGGPGVPPHPGEGYAVPALHGADAKADLVYCQLCHGTPGTPAFDGSALSSTACSACHAEAAAHPTDWMGSGAHAHVSAGNIDAACGLCHQLSTGAGVGLPGAPSCFVAEFGNSAGQTRPCHAGGPGVPPHAETGYAEPLQHGVAAKADLIYCQQCHGVLGTTAFGGSVLTVTDCDGCHTAARAHPTDWQGIGPYSHRNAGEAPAGCTVCHDVSAGRAAPDPSAPSCFANSWSNSAGQTRACHPDGPGPVHAENFTDPTNHGSQAKGDLAACQQCHGTPGEPDFGGGITGVSCADCHLGAEAHPDNWQGDPNSGSYSHRSAGALSLACGICHEVSQGTPGRHPAAPSCFSTVFDSSGAPSGVRACHPGGPGPVHASATFSDPAEHGQEAKADLKGCQPCHADPHDGVALDGDPTFNVPNGLLAAGCESAGCHSAGAAHPVPWLGPAATNHQSAGNLAAACTLCHELDGIGADSPRSCHGCHAAGSPLQPQSCISCHNAPPDGQGPAGPGSPNQDGGHSAHSGIPELAANCDACHSGAGADTVAHYDELAPADVLLAAVWDAESAPPQGASYDGGTTTCSDVSCHGGQETPAWLTETMDVDTQCELCHKSDAVAPPQHNDFVNDVAVPPAPPFFQHDFHLTQLNTSLPPPQPVIVCTDCHNVVTLNAQHFDTLSTRIMEGPASATIGGGATSLVNYDPVTTGCSLGCHAFRTWR